MRIEPYLDAIAVRAIKDALGADAPAIVRPTQDSKHGDYQINGVLGLAKQLKKNPRELAGQVAEIVSAHEAIASAEVAGPGFVNLKLSDAWIAARLDVAVADRARDGVETVAKPEKIIVDFSSPNIAKQMHVGHIRSTIIGDAIVRLLRFAGHEVVADNHLGDWGTQFGLLIVGMRRFGDDAALESDPIVELERVYKLASAALKEDPSVGDESRAELAKLQAGDAENRKLWERFVAATRKSLDAIYDRLGVRFDAWLGESAYDAMLPGVVSMLLDRKIAREDEGAIVVWFGEQEAAPDKLKKQTVPFIIRKKDGAFLYSTSDIATIFYRRDHFHADRSIYVVDSRQGGHFEQLFATARLLGVEMRLEHVGFGMVLGADGTALKTRAGGTITLAALLDEAEERASKLMCAAPLSLPEEQARGLAPAVGIGAVKYADLRQNRTSDYKFDWEKLIAFDGNCGPYLQYAHARCAAILRKAESEPGAIVIAHPAERALAAQLLKLDDSVHGAAEQCFPHFVAEHLYTLAREYSTFYESCPVLKAETDTSRATRLALVDLTRRQLARGLGLLGIEAPDRM